MSGYAIVLPMQVDFVAVFRVNSWWFTWLVHSNLRGLFFGAYSKVRKVIRVSAL